MASFQHFGTKGWKAPHGAHDLFYFSGSNLYMSICILRPHTENISLMKCYWFWPIYGAQNAKEDHYYGRGIYVVSLS